MKTPLVSIIVPCYNQAQYLGEALQSVLNQSFEDWECIIVNDGSPDNTDEIVKKWIARDARFKYIFKENGGVSSARNLGIEIAVGEYILPLDGDDKIGKEYVKEAVLSFEKDNSLKVVYCKAEKFGDENGEWILNPFSLYNLSRKNIIFCSALFRKKEWELVGGYDVNMDKGLEDWEFWIAILKNGGKVYCLQGVGFYYRIKEKSRNNQLIGEDKKNLLAYLNIKHADFFVRELGSSIELYQNLNDAKSSYRRKLKSKKNVIDLFCKTFFRFTIFNKSKDFD
ncbi:glycosyltransferase family A protein [Flavobacterium tructae]|uniref:glycosyltransferase family 2 protein n=1 Tax=Flavobacterium tructae TaxID=1114873 RepID=UPI002551D940|nr:glycosyltransferase family A protein [Flavobacterium tructae]MDL2143352.1 glycosyltransferase family A protein [Flavobacterium tructae]